MPTYGNQKSNAATSGGSGTTRTVTASNSTSIAIDVTADGDGEYLFEFCGTTNATQKTLKLQANGADLTFAQGNAIRWDATGAVSQFGFQGVGTVALQQTDSITLNCYAKGRFSSFSGRLSSLHSDFGFEGSANHAGFSTVGHAPATTLTQISLVSTVASGLVSGTFWVRKVA